MSHVPPHAPQPEFDDFEALEDPTHEPLGDLPRISGRHAQLSARLARWKSAAAIEDALDWLREAGGPSILVGGPEIVWRPSGLGRMGVVAQFLWPRVSTRVAVGLETSLAHALVDRMLGFDRAEPEHRLTVSPVEWGILTFVMAESLRRLSQGAPGPFGPWDLTIDRVGPDPFDINGLGHIVTIHWPVTLGTVVSAIRLWIPESLVHRWLSTPPQGKRDLATFPAPAEWNSVWRVEAGSIPLPRGMKTLRVGGVLPLIDTRLSGSPRNLAGSVEMTLTVAQPAGRYLMRAEPLAQSGGSRVRVVEPCQFQPIPREALTLNPGTTPPATEAVDAANDMPVTLSVELGRVNLTLSRLADLKPGDVLELGRHSREPVELTSGGRLVARGELVQIDTELGVRILNVFL